MGILPTLREKRRYIQFTVTSERRFTKQKVESALCQSLISLFGEHGFSLAGMRLVNFDERTQAGELKCARDEVERVRASLAMVCSIDGCEARIDVAGVSGTLKRLRRNYLKV